MKFSLRTFLFLAVTLSIGFAGILQPLMERKRAKETLLNCSGVFWLHEKNESDSKGIDLEFPFLVNHFGERFLDPIKGAVISPVPNDEHKLESFLSQRRGLVGLEELTILSNETIDPAAYRPIKLLDDVRFLTIRNGVLDRQCFESFANMDDLENLKLIDCQFSARDLAVLKTSKHLAWLHLYGKGVDQLELDQSRRELRRTFVTYGDFDSVNFDEQ